MLARYLNIDERAIEDRQLVQRDLALQGFDLGLIAFDLVAEDPEHGPFPVAMLRPEMTVGEIVELHEAWSSRSWEDGLPDTERAPETLPDRSSYA